MIFYRYKNNNTVLKTYCKFKRMIKRTLKDGWLSNRRMEKVQ